MFVLHGFRDHPDSFQSFLKRFNPSDYTLVAPSLRGYPPSKDVPDHHVFLLDLVGDLIGLADSLGRIFFDPRARLGRADCLRQGQRAP